ncbi:MAG TPA: hypothetical protein EYP14_18560 [Planctomycetaceae bacterium]|nr:hypothetical protein [Planctomycetaceae bacterium]
MLRHGSVGKPGTHQGIAPAPCSSSHIRTGRDRRWPLLARLRLAKRFLAAVAAARALKPRALIAEQPVIQEAYDAHGVGEAARALIQAFDSAADRGRSPELLALGLEPHAAEKLSLIGTRTNELHGIRAPTLRVTGPANEFSPRLGPPREGKCPVTQLLLRLLDRPRLPKDFLGLGVWKLPLKPTRGRVASYLYARSELSVFTDKAGQTR